MCDCDDACEGLEMCCVGSACLFVPLGIFCLIWGNVLHKDSEKINDVIAANCTLVAIESTSDSCECVKRNAADHNNVVARTSSNEYFYVMESNLCNGSWLDEFDTVERISEDCACCPYVWDDDSELECSPSYELGWEPTECWVDCTQGRYTLDDLSTGSMSTGVIFFIVGGVMLCWSCFVWQWCRRRYNGYSMRSRFLCP